MTYNVTTSEIEIWRKYAVTGLDVGHRDALDVLNVLH